VSGSGSRPDSVAALGRLDEITRRLRRECPWDREQDERSIVPHTVEEAYELADAAAAGDDAKLVDELGDVLFQVHFLALLLSERGAGDLATVAEQMTAKLIRRHPHVFGEEVAADSGAVLANWDRIKREQEGRDGLFTDVPENLPALLYARKLQRRAVSRAPRGAELGVSGAAETTEVVAALRAAADRLQALADKGASGAPGGDDAERDQVFDQLGELLFAAVDLARRLRCDPELALRAAAERFRRHTAEQDRD
jgi:MazG family protein